MLTRKINLIVIHCTAWRCTSTLTPQQLERMHLANGWSGCGYHYYITRDGRIHPMRPISAVGAHAKGYNTNSIGVAYEGGLDANGKPADTRTPMQILSLRMLLQALVRTFPGTRICGHRDLSPDLNGNGIIEPSEYIKMCPCFNAAEEYKLLIREQ